MALGCLTWRLEWELMPVVQDMKPGCFAGQRNCRRAGDLNSATLHAQYWIRLDLDKSESTDEWAPVAQEEL